MAATLNSTIHNILNDSANYSTIRSCVGMPSITPTMYMEIPVSSDTFELPALALQSFKDMLHLPQPCNILVARLFSCGHKAHYKSIESIMKSVLSTPISNSLSLIKVPGVTNSYYATFGAVFDHQFKPLMMLSWIMEKIVNREGREKYLCKRPLLRLSPQTCLEKEDSIQRFLVNRFLTKALDTDIVSPYFYDCDAFFEQSRFYNSRLRSKIKVEIDECPFVIRGTDTPSISTTNEALLEIVAEHIDEITP